jgi:hypothetical protein
MNIELHLNYNNKENFKAADGGYLCFNTTGHIPNLPINIFIQKKQIMQSLFVASSTKVFFKSMVVILLFIAGFSSTSLGQSKSLSVKGGGIILIEAVSNGKGAYDYAIKSGDKIILQSKTAQSLAGGYKTAESAVAAGEKTANFYTLTDLTATELTPESVKARVEAANNNPQVHNK